MIKDNHDSWISRDKGGWVEVNFKEDVKIRHFSLRTSNYYVRDQFGQTKWVSGTPNFDLRSSYRNVKFLVDGVEKGKSPSDLRVEERKKVLDVMSWRYDKSEIITGRNFKLQWPSDAYSSGSYLEVVYGLSDDGGHLSRTVRGHNAASGVISGSVQYLTGEKNDLYQGIQK